MIKVVNIIPQSLSSETQQDSEPNIAVNPKNVNQIAISAFTPNPMGGPNAPIFISLNGGTTWALNPIVPSSDPLTGTGDITIRFSGTNRLYGGILRKPGNLRLNILRTANFASPTVMSALVDRLDVDQPYVAAATVPRNPNLGKDRVYVGHNDFAATGGRTATVERSLDAAATFATFSALRIEKRSTGGAGQNGPQIRPAVHPDGTVYAIFYGWRSFGASNLVTSDVVVVRDDNWASGATPFTALKDPSDNVAGRLVVKNVTFTWNGSMGQERLGGDLSIAIDPNNSSNVYIAYCDVQSTSYTIHIRRSTDRGATWSGDLKTISNAKNPALAIATNGRVGLAYQRVTGSGSSQRWDTHLEMTSDDFGTSEDLVLATVPANTPTPLFLPYIGDYIHMMAVGTSFYGVFSAANTPDAANFPQGVTYLRNHDFAQKKLFGVNGTSTVSPSIDPFFFRFSPVTITTLTHLTQLTQLTRLTRLTLLTQFTRFTPFTGSMPVTRVGPPVGPPGGPPVGPGGGGEAAGAFIRFGNTVFAPEQLNVGRFEVLAPVADGLVAAGVTRIDQLATADPYALASQLGWTRDDAARVIEVGQQLLRALAQ